MMSIQRGKEGKNTIDQSIRVSKAHSEVQHIKAGQQQPESSYSYTKTSIN